jgi:hypothetical protein
MELVPGSPTARAAGQARDQSRIAANVVIGNIDNAKNLSSYWTTGLLGSYTSRIPGTPGHDLAATIETLGSNAAFERLQAMRESSPTGGALGQVSNYENQMLRSAYWSLAQSQSKEQFERNLDNFKKTFLDVVYGTDERLKDRLDAGEITKKQYDDTISLKRGAAGQIVPSEAQAPDVGAAQPAAPVGKAPPGKVAIPYDDAVATLKKNPTATNRAYFDSIFGRGEAAKALGK